MPSLTRPRLVASAAAILCCISAAAQEPAQAPALGYKDSYQIAYTDANFFVNNHLPLVGVTNMGFHAAGDICVNVYSFRTDATFFTCCSCRLAANEHITLTVRNFNIDPGGLPASLTIKLIASVPVAGTCDARVSP